MTRVTILFTVLSILLFRGANLMAQCCQFTYQQQEEPLTSAATFGVALADFDNDGDQDAVSVSAYFGIDVYFNDGLGTFTLDDQYLTGNNNSFYGVQTGDVDNDDDPDIIAYPFYSANSLTILNNTGTGNFTTTTVSSNIAVYNGASGDVNGDFFIDIFLPNSGGGSGLVYTNDGTGDFNLKQTLPGARGHDVQLADLDGDDDLDAFVVENSAYGNSVFLNDGLGIFTQSGTTFGADGSSVGLGDFDGDEDIDAWVGKSGSSAEIWLNDGSGIFTLQSTLTTGSYCKKVNIYDFEGDGDLDVFMGFYSSAPQVWLNEGDLNFSLCYQAPVGSSSHGLAVGLIDNDNRVDIYSGYFSNDEGDYVFLNDSPYIEYPDSPFCPGISAPQQVIQLGTGGGSYSVSPSGLDIDPLTGAIIPANSIPGNYLVNYTVEGCTVSTVVVIKSLDLTVYVIESMLTANQESASYQWIDCNNSFLPVPGATGQSFEPEVTGDYAVIITYDGCTDTSSCAHVVIDGFRDIQVVNDLAVYPNPAKGYIIIKANGNINGSEYYFYDKAGKVVLSGILNDASTRIDLDNLPAGIYSLEVGEANQHVFKVIKE